MSDPFVTSRRVSEEEGSWSGAAFCSCELCWLECSNCYWGLPETGSPRWRIRRLRQEVPAFNWRQNQEVKPQGVSAEGMDGKFWGLFRGSQGFSSGPLGTEEDQGEVGGEEEEEGDAHQLLAF